MNFNTEMCPCDQRYKMLSGIVSPRLQPDVICDGQQHLEEHFHDTPEHYQEHFHETPLLHSTNVTSSSDCTSNKLHSDMVVSKPPLDHRNSTSHKATYISGGKLKLKATTSTSDKHVRWKEKDARISPVASDNKENGEEYPERPPRSHKETVREFRRRMKQRIAQEHQQQILSSDGRPNSAREHRTETLRHKRRQPEPFGKTQAWPSEKDISSQSMSRKQDIGNYDTATLHHSSSHSEPVSESVGKKNVEINSKTRLTSKSLDDLDISYVNYQDTLNKDKTNTNTPNTTVVHGIKPNSSSVNSESYHKIVNSQAHSPEKLERLRSPDALSRQHNKAARDSRHQTAIVNMAHLVQPESNAPRQKVGGGRQRSFSDLGFKTKDMLQTPRTMALLQNPAFRKHITKTLDLTDETSEQEVKETIEKRFEALKMGSAHSTHLRQSYSQDRVTRSHPPLKMCQSDSNIVSQMHSYARTLKRETSNESVFQSDGEENMPNSANQTQTQENTGAKNNCKTESTNLKADISRHRIPSYTQFKSQRRQNGLRSLSGSAEVLVPEAIAEEEGVKVQHRPVSASNIPSSRSRSVSNNVSKSSPDTNKFRTSDYVFTTTPEDLSLMSRSLETVNIPKRPWRKRSRKLSNSAENPISTLTQEQHKTALSKSQSVDTFKQFKQDSLLIKEDKLLTKSQSQSDNLDKTERIPKAPPRKSKKRDGLFVSKSTSSLYGMNKKTNHRRHNSQEDEVILDFTTLEGSVTEQPPTANELGYVSRSMSDVSDKIAEEKRTRASKDKKYKAYMSDPFQTTRRSGNSKSLQPDIQEESREEVLAFLQQETTAGSNSINSHTSSQYIPGTVVERVDSGVGRETSAGHGPQVPSCEDCETSLAGEGDGVFICSKCEKRRGERKDIIQEIVDSETSYGQDLHIIQQEFYVPMKSGHLLSPEHIHTIFLNLEELIIINESFSEQLQDALDLANEQGMRIS